MKNWNLFGPLSRHIRKRSDIKQIKKWDFMPKEKSNRIKPIPIICIKSEEELKRVLQCRPVDYTNLYQLSKDNRNGRIIVLCAKPQIAIDLLKDNIGVLDRDYPSNVRIKSGYID